MSVKSCVDRCVRVYVWFAYARVLRSEDCCRGYIRLHSYFHLYIYSNIYVMVANIPQEVRAMCVNSHLLRLCIFYSQIPLTMWFRIYLCHITPADYRWRYWLFLLKRTAHAFLILHIESASCLHVFLSSRCFIKHWHTWCDARYPKGFLYFIIVFSWNDAHLKWFHTF